MNFIGMNENNLDAVIPFYIEYYNEVEGSCWTYDTVYKRLHQVVNYEGACCVIAEEKGAAIGFAIGYFQQYDDLVAYNLEEIVVDKKYQKQGVGTAIMLEIETRAREAGASLIQLQAVNDEMHKHFYGEKLQYKKANSFVSMTKWL